MKETKEQVLVCYVDPTNYEVYYLNGLKVAEGYKKNIFSPKEDMSFQNTQITHFVRINSVYTLIQPGPDNILDTKINKRK